MPQPDAFDYIVAIQLIIVAIGITKILEGISWVIEHRDTCVTFWVHTRGTSFSCHPGPLSDCQASPGPGSPTSPKGKVDSMRHLLSHDALHAACACCEQ